MGEMKTAAEELEASLTQLLLIEGKFSPEKREAMLKLNDELGRIYSMQPEEIISARLALSQNGIVGDLQEQVLGPILQASAASNSSPETIANAVKTVVKNLNVAPEDVPSVLDRMLYGGKAGSFEIEDMATAFPELASIYANSGRTGMPAVDELIAMGQIVRESTGTSGAAATGMREILNKIYSPEVLKAMEGAGINIKDLDKQAKKADQPVLPLILDAIEKKGMTDKFGLGELVTDTNARAALEALSQKRDGWNTLLDDIRTKSDGETRRDFEIVSKTAKFRSGQRDAALGASGRDFGEMIAPMWNGFMDFVTATINDDYAVLLRYRDKDAADIISKIDYAKARIETINADRSAVPGADFQLADLKLEIKRLEANLRTLEKQRGLPEGSLSQSGNTRVTPDTTTEIVGGLPIPNSRPSENLPVPKIRPSDIKAPSEPLSELKANVEKDIDGITAMIGQAVSLWQSMFNFNASPSITPRVSQPSGGSGVRQQNRDVRASKNRALHETGPNR
jgi:TP901 family phage tail tape measure protein